MPEFPEVRTFINHLKKQHMLGQKVTSVNFIDDKVLKNSNQKTFSKFIVGEKFVDIDQIGKLIVITLSNDKYLTIHLRMEGKLFFIDSSIKPDKFTMVEMICGKKKLVYLDFRKFGTFYIYRTKNEFLKSTEVTKMGPQPFDSKLTASYLIDCFTDKSQSIKTSLLDQSIIAGIGNIYADEILFECKINPQRKAKHVSKIDCEHIIKSCRKIMKQAIENSGTTVSSYAFAPNHAGSFQKYLKVHTRENQPCKVCKTKIKKITVNGRGTYYCPKCQEK
ncbi:MAG: bifunctional DNA-formamidopyrimidine glycosylase/DNA-(apurinic or apyrimidinic site) lyase [Mycoplasmoidaceae bacterium]|nr:bifunctional DNA-formamidopyrimidine glycosylase/DNA-(apurinic or apyrimidinic site) lyase [Mycoplasmoidaceae bacterium]